MIKFKHKGSFTKTEKLLTRAKDLFNTSFLDHYGKLGVEALKEATPKDSGKTSESWYYETEYRQGSISLIWKNSNINQNVQIAVILQYGHGTRNGGYVEGIDYINPAMKPIFNDIADKSWKELIGS